jgi:hypothetical protein
MRALQKWKKNSTKKWKVSEINSNSKKKRKPNLTKNFKMSRKNWKILKSNFLRKYLSSKNKLNKPRPKLKNMKRKQVHLQQSYKGSELVKSEEKDKFVN